MRRIQAAVVLAFLASCAVKTTSDALCLNDENCPADERCQHAGSDAGRCVACVPDARCVNVEGTSCSADGAAKVTCQHNAGSCWYRTEVNCASQGLSCGLLGGALECLCPDNSEAAVLYVDPAHGSSSPHATGVKDPPQCRYRTLTEALALAKLAVQAQAGQTGTAKVILTGAAGPSSPVVFGVSTETPPLAVTSGVSLETEDVVAGAPATGAYVMTFDAAAGPAVTLDPGSRIAGLLLQNVSTSSGASPVVSIACATGAQFTLDSLSIEGASDGGFTAARGIDLDGACTANLTAVTIEHTSSDGVVVAGGARLDATALNVSTGDNGGGGGGGDRSGGNGVTVIGPSSSLALHGGRIEKNGQAGIEVSTLGTLSVDQGASVSGNGTSGILLQASSATLTGMSNHRITVSENLGSGVLFCNGNKLCGTNTSATFQVSAVDFTKNGDGVAIQNEAGTQIALQSSTFDANTGDGVKITASAAAAAGVSSTVVDGCRFTGGTHAIELVGDTDTWVTVQDNTLSGASDTAFVAALVGGGHSGLTMRHNTIVDNKTTTARGLGASLRKVGGLFFSEGAPTLVFEENTVARNEGDQLFVSSNDGNPWQLGASDCTKANVFGCYAFASGAVGVAAEGATVYAEYAYWRKSPPVKGTDLYSFNGGSILLAPSLSSGALACGSVAADLCP